MDSNELLIKIKQHLIPDLHIFENRFNPIDAFSTGLDMAVEVKSKKGFYQEVMIEKQKWLSLAKYNKTRYINLMEFPDTGTKVVFSFNTKKLPEPIWEWKKIPDASNELFTKWIDTEVGYFHIKNGKNITQQLAIK